MLELLAYGFGNYGADSWGEWDGICGLGVVLQIGSERGPSVDCQRIFEKRVWVRLRLLRAQLRRTVMAARGVSRGWGEFCLVGGGGGDGGGEVVVDGEDRVFRADGAEGLEVFLLHDREGVQDVAHRVAGRRELRLQGVARVAAPLVARAQVEMEEGGVEFRSQLESTLFVPHEGRALVSAVLRERLKIPGRVYKFEDAGEEPFGDRRFGLPRRGSSEE